jgi:lipopolysaccharide/colanic/teichoic acid biosynthesis glycosyltransferase
MAFCAIMALWPLFALLALAVKVSSPGPVFYRAGRLGVGGKPIRVLKFRTMYADADSRLEQMLAEDPDKAAEWRERFKLADDPRITPLGKFLRKTSMDELPQFWNVLTGEMAVVGPRPIVEKEIQYYGDKYEIMKRVKPGITGLWQVSGRSDTNYGRRVLLDTYYIMNWSPWLDYFIFLKTIKEVFLCRGAE